MAGVINALSRLVVRTVLLLLALLFLLGILAASLVLLAFWLMQALWARLTGRPVQPLVFTLLRQAQWRRFYPTGPGRRADEADVIDVQARSVDADRLPRDRG